MNNTNFITGDAAKAVPLEDTASKNANQNKPHQPVRGSSIHIVDELPFYDKDKKDE